MFTSSKLTCVDERCPPKQHCLIKPSLSWIGSFWLAAGIFSTFWHIFEVAFDFGFDMGVQLLKGTGTKAGLQSQL